MKRPDEWEKEKFEWGSGDYWRGRADECRAVADNMRTPSQATFMRGIAGQYDQLAQYADDKKKLAIN